MNKATQLEELLGKVFDDAREGLREELPSDEYERRRHDFVFHMVDWKDDLKQLARMFDNPDEADAEAAATFMIGFMYHVLPHLNAAGRLLVDEVRDHFAEASGTPVKHGS